MSLFDFISVDQKRNLLQTARESLAIELVSVLIRVGIDPETFDFETYTPDQYGNLGETSIRIAQMCDGIKLSELKLAELA
jgi:hypothetical protein